MKSIEFLPPVGVLIRSGSMFGLAIGIVIGLVTSGDTYALDDSAERPNVILIMTDNHGAWTLGCYGNEEIRTPNIDQLAAEGTLFTRAFASNPVCSPTRATFLTGLIPSQHGIHSFLTGGGLQTGPEARCTLDQFESLPEILGGAGYACGLVGKWHLGGNLTPQEGFHDYWVTMPHGGTSTFYDAAVIEDGVIRKEPQYLTDFWTEHAVRFIDSKADGDEPFFLFLAYNGPYSLSRLLLREGRNRHASYYADQPLRSFPRVKPHPWQLNNLDYINNPTSIRRVATEVSGVDDGVGEVLRSLEAHGIDDNTMVVFVADQGWVGGHGGFFGMGDHTRPLTARDGMMQIPMIWRHPNRIAAGQRRDQLVANYDFLPTLLGHLGIGDRMPAAPRSPGRDFSSLLRPESGSDFGLDSKGGAVADSKSSDAVFYEFENLRCIRTRTHKYIHRHPNGPHELYDLQRDPDEFDNLVDDPFQAATRSLLKKRLDDFYLNYASPKYDMWNGGTSQVRIHDGIDEEMAQLPPVEPPPLPDGFKPAPIVLPPGFRAELAAAPPLVTHPTMACLDPSGALYVCNNSGVNMDQQQLETQRPNAIRRLVDQDGDGRFDSSTLFADNMTFPMGCVWHQGSLFVASPPNIWRLTDGDGDGVAEQRDVIVDRFGFTGNAASIHGCFFGPDGRLYWTDGYHGHEFTDQQGKVTSSREGSYLFSCWPDGTDVQIHCGGGMDNPVEIDFTESGDLVGTVNILYTRPRVDCLVHWLYGGAYPHRKKVLGEIAVTGDLLGPVHRFGHVAVSGLTRYRSGTLDLRWRDNLFTTFFNSGKVVRLELQSDGASYRARQHEFLRCDSRDFHPTDVLEDADGSLLVVDTGGWFYRGCPTSQFSKPELLGAIYRIRRETMTSLVDAWGNRIDWDNLSANELVKLLNDTRFAVRQRAMDHCTNRGSEVLEPLRRALTRGDVRVRQNAVWVLGRLASTEALTEQATEALKSGLVDAVAEIRQATCHAMATSRAGGGGPLIIPLLDDDSPMVRREAAATLGRLGVAQAVPALLDTLRREDVDRAEEHALVYALLEIGNAAAVRQAMLAIPPTSKSVNERLRRATWCVLDQTRDAELSFADLSPGLDSDDDSTRRAAIEIIRQHSDWLPDIHRWIKQRLAQSRKGLSLDQVEPLLTLLVGEESTVPLIADMLRIGGPKNVRSAALSAIAKGPMIQPHASWVTPLEHHLLEGRRETSQQAIRAIAAIAGDHFQSSLWKVANDPQRSSAERLDALEIIARRAGRIETELFRRLRSTFQSGSLSDSVRAAQILGASRLSADQLKQVAPLLAQASPSETRDLLPLFSRSLDPATANSFLEAMESADVLLSLEPAEFSNVVKRFPRQSLSQANRILDQLQRRRDQQIERLEMLRGRLEQGDADRGAEVFASQKAKCATCHRIGESGAIVGPDLTTIGANRSAEDLLESIVFPSASIVRQYETQSVLTVDGRVVVGVMVDEEGGVMQLQQADGRIVSIRQEDVDQIKPQAVSIMPAGLSESLSEGELLDVVTYLQSLR